MKSSKILEIETQASEFLSAHKINAIPTPIEGIAEQLKIKIAYASSDEYSGILIKKSDNQVFMGCNSSEPYTRQRFTIAHELAHFVLHQAKEAFVDKKIMVDYRDNQNIAEVNPEREAEANIFAAAILMPEKNLKNDFDSTMEGKTVFLEDHLSELSSRYQVSKDAMKYRLTNLSLIKI